MCAGGVLCGVGVEGGAAGLQEEDEVAGVGVVGGVFPVYVDSVETPVFHERDSGARKLSSASRRASR